MYNERYNPYFSEALFFLHNPNVGGYANFDTNEIVHNPFNNFDKNQRRGIAINEGTRLFLNNHPMFKPSFNLTPYQKFIFSNYGSDQDKRNTIMGRYLSNDNSIGIPSEEQIDYGNYLRKVMDIYNE